MTAHALPEVTEAVERAGRADPPHLDALPQPADGRAGRAHRRPVGHPRRQGLLHHQRAPRPTTPPCCWPPRTGGPTRSWRCATATTGGRSPRSRSPATALVADVACRRSRPSTCTAATATAARSPGLGDDEFIAACVADLSDVLDHATAGDVAALIAEPIQGVGGFTHAARRALGAFAKVLDEHGILWISDEVQTGWGRTGEHFWGWQAHAAAADARHRHLRQGHRATGCRSAGSSPAPRSWTACAPTRSRRSAAPRSPRRGAGQPRLPARARPAGQRRRGRPGPARRAARLVARTRSSATSAGKGLMIGVELVRPGHRRARAGRAARAPCWRPPDGAGCWSARAACTATSCASPRRCRSPRRRPTEGFEALAAAAAERRGAGAARGGRAHP